MDIEAKDKRFEWKERIVIVKPDIYEFEIEDEFNFMVIDIRKFLIFEKWSLNILHAYRKRI